ncbi:MAG: sigma-70 family RNA polymerase sigma factor [Acidobacteriota bacterium]
MTEMNETAATLPNEMSLLATAKTEPAAFSAIYEHYFPRVYTYIRYRIRNAPTADDIAAAVFERVLARLGDYRPESGPFAGWLYAIARNTVSDYQRTERRRRGFLTGLLFDKPSHEPAQDDAMILGERRFALMAAIARLSDRERDVLALRFSAGLGNKAIAKLTGMRESNVAVIVFRALGRLRADLSSTR